MPSRFPNLTAFLFLITGWLLVAGFVVATGLGVGWIVHRLIPAVDFGLAALLGAYGPSPRRASSSVSWE